eukprot:c6210_g1_i1.p1 GENE.c6210_g1_i1~~c6210_g1_i1.p1  ORF type:complete len:681 (+),score=188.79 c6210_g1_i1:116-2158(+)
MINQRLKLALSLFLIGTFVWTCNAESSFNFEIARRTTDNVQSFLNTAHFPNSQVASAFASGMLDLASPTVYDRLQLLAFTQYLAVPLASGLTTTFVDGSTIAFNRNSATCFVMKNASCSTPQASATCGNVYNFTDDGSLLYPAIREVTWNASSNPWFGKASTSNSSFWSRPYLQSDGSAFAIAFSTPVFDINGLFIGVTTTELTLSSLDEFLYEYFGNEPDGRVVFITEVETNYLIASSPLDQITVHDVNGVLTMVDATQSPVKTISDASVFLNATKDRQQEVLYVHKGYYVQSTPYYDAAGINWDVVVVRPADSQEDYIVTGSTTYYVICVVASLSMLATAALIVWVVRFRKMNLWKAAQPSVLVLILISNMMCVSCAFVLMGAPSTARCLGRQWMICLSITFTCAAFLAKILRVYVVSTAKMVQIDRNAGTAAANGAATKTHRQHRGTWLFSASHVVFLVLLMLVAQVVLLGFWTGLDPMRPHQHYKQQLDVLVAYETCASSSQWGMAVSGSLIAALFIAGCYLSFLTRNYSEMFAESRALMMTFYHGAFISLLLVLVALFANVSTKSMLLFVVMSMVWFTITTQAALFMPRIYRQVTLGDFTMWEMREMVKQHLKVQSNAAKNVEPDMNFGGVGQAHVHAHANARVSFGNGMSASTPSERNVDDQQEKQNSDVQYVI